MHVQQYIYKKISPVVYCTHKGRKTHWLMIFWETYIVYCEGDRKLRGQNVNSGNSEAGDRISIAFRKGFNYIVQRVLTNPASVVAVPPIAHSMQKAIFSPQAIINETDMANGKTMFLSLLLM